MNRSRLEGPNRRLVIFGEAEDAMTDDLRGGFVIPVPRLRAMLERCSGSDEVATCSSAVRTAAQVLEALEAFPLDEVVVHWELDYSYVLRLDPGFARQEVSREHWFEVDLDSVIFQELAAEHRRWVDLLPDLGRDPRALLET